MIVVDTHEGVAKTFTTARWGQDVKQGDTLTLAGTVKRHDVYQAAKETILARCKPA